MHFFFKRLFFKKIIYLFIYSWPCWVFVSVRGLSLVAASGGHSSSRCAGLSLSRPLLLRSTGSSHTGSVVVAHGPSCSAACRPGLKTMSLALGGRFSTTAPPGKPEGFDYSYVGSSLPVFCIYYFISNTFNLFLYF